MNNLDQALSNTNKKFLFPVLRFLFVCGFALRAVLTFVPHGKMQVRSFFGHISGESNVSSYDQIQQIFQAGNFFAGMFLVLLFAINIAFIVLAVAYPKRWVFITGSSYTAFWMLAGLFTPASEDIEYFIFHTIFSYFASALKLTGFFVKPAVNDSETTKIVSHYT